MAPDILPPGYERSLYQVATLASVNPTTDDVQSLHAGIILQVLEGLEQGAEPETIRKRINGSTGIAVPIEAVVAAVGRLVQEGHLLKGSNFRVMLTPAKAQELRTQAENFRALRNTVIERWLDELDRQLFTSTAQGLSALERLQLEEDTTAFLLQLVRYHGAEVALFLYPDAEGNRAVLNIDQKELFRALPRREDRLEGVREQALPAFVREATPERADFIARLLHRAALVQILQADPMASAIFSETISSKTLYLDTNFAFRLLGLQGEQLRMSARDALELGREFGHVFKVSTRTFEELQNLVQRQGDWLSKHGDIPRSLAGTAAEFVAGNDYVSAYWRDRERQGTTVEQFRTVYSQLSLRLENLAIDISKDLASEIPSTPELRDAVTQLKVFKSLDPDLLIEHDAFHKVLIERLRVNDLGRQPEGWHEVKFVFLTFDSVLPVYATRLAQLKRGHRIPFCLMGHEWLQLLYFIRPHAAMSPHAFVSLVNSPYLEAYFSRRVLSRDLVRDVVSTMGEMREYRPRIAQKLLADRTLTRKMAATTDAKERERLIQDAVRNEAGLEDRRVAETLKNKDGEIEGLKIALKGKERDMQALEREVQSQRLIVKRKGVEAASRSEQQGAERQKLKEEKQALQQQVRTKEQEVEEYRSLATGYKGLAEKVASLEGELSATREQRKKEMWLLLAIPLFLFMYGVGRLLSGDARDIVAWIALSVGAAPVVAGIRSRFRGRWWELVSRVANLFGIGVIFWEYVPGLKTTIQRLLALIAGQ